jgi:hypothetical protein
MDMSGEKIEYAIANTEVVRSPRQRLATFGETQIYYYLVAEPVYAELTGAGGETVVREGRVMAERPKIVTPHYLLNLFQGFEHGHEYADYIRRKYGDNEPGLLYRYRNEPKGMNIISSPLNEVVGRLNELIDREKNPLTSIIKGVDEMWDVSLMKFIHELTRHSMQVNVSELDRWGLLDVDRSGVPAGARRRIEDIFLMVEKGYADASHLKAELERWGVFWEYEDRFLNLFRKGKIH